MNARLLVVVVAITGCRTPQTAFQPTRVAPGELTLRYSGDAEVWAGGSKVAGKDWALLDHVWCVPAAEQHAERAESAASRALALKWLAGGVSLLGGIGGLASINFKGKDDTAMLGLLVGAATAQVVALTFGFLSVSARYQANGHGVDAVNLYNDAVGFSGGACPRRASSTRPEPFSDPRAEGRKALQPRMLRLVGETGETVVPASQVQLPRP